MENAQLSDEEFAVLKAEFKITDYEKVRLEKMINFIMERREDLEREAFQHERRRQLVSRMNELIGP